MNAQERKVAAILGAAFGIAGSVWLIYLAGWATFGALLVLLWGHSLSMRAVHSADAEMLDLEARISRAEEQVRRLRLVP